MSSLKHSRECAKATAPRGLPMNLPLLLLTVTVAAANGTSHNHGTGGHLGTSQDFVAKQQP